MPVSLHIEKLSKKFGVYWILKSVNLNIYHSEKIAILGSNGSGKSTFLKIIAGFIYYDKGKITWKNEATGTTSEYPDFAFSSPYIDLFNHLTIREHIEFHFKQKQCINQLTVDEILEVGNLADHQSKQISQLSSGIRQRFKNVLAILTNSEVLFLDEPCSNLDEANIALYQKLVAEYTKNRTVFIASNNPAEYDFICTKEFRIENQNLQLLTSKQLWA